MTVGQFAEAVAKLRRKYGGNETSRGRTDQHSIDVGGFADDPHNWDLGSDMVYAHGPNRLGSEHHPKFPQSCPHCSEDGLKVIHEKTCDHYQPADFPAGPVTVYDGQMKSWT